MDDLKYGELLETVSELTQDFEALKKENTRLVNMVNERFRYVKEAFDMITGRKRRVCKSEPMSENQLWTIEARAEAATPGPWVVELPEWGECAGIRSKNGTQILNAGTCIPDPQTAIDLGGTAQDWKENPYDYGVHKWDDAAFIAASREDVPALLAEVDRLRDEVALLKDEVASLEQELKFSDETEYELIKKLFDLKICHKEWICEQDGSSELNFEGENGCLFCWRQWAIMKARKEVGEEGSHEWPK